MFQFRDIKLTELSNIGTSIQFNGQTIPPLPNGETLTYARAGVNAIAGPSSAGNAWLWQNGAWEHLNSRPVGGWGVVLDETYVAWQEENYGTLRMRLDDYTKTQLLPVPWQATGLLDMVNGVVRADDRSQPFYFIWNDVQYHGFMWMTRQGRTVMPANNLPGGVGVVVWDDNTQQLWRVSNVDTQVPPRLSEDGKTVALTGDYAQGFVPDTAWTLEPQAQPIPPIVLLTKPTLFGAFLHPNQLGGVPHWANSYIDEGKGGRTLCGVDGQQWAICDLEQTPGAVMPSPACYIGAKPSDFAHLWPKRNQYDLYALEVYRSAGMTDDEFSAFAGSSLGQVPPPTVIITNSTTRIGPNGPTLTPRDVQAAQSILSQFGYPVLVFEAGRPGEVPETAAQFTQWRNGQNCPPQVLPPNRPPQGSFLLL